MSINNDTKRITYSDKITIKSIGVTVWRNHDPIYVDHNINEQTNLANCMRLSSPQELKDLIEAAGDGLVITTGLEFAKLVTKCGQQAMCELASLAYKKSR